MLAIQTENLSKNYGSLHALKGLTLSVPAGRVFGFLGANGAGKTTTVRLLLGLIKPTSGMGTVLGMPVDHHGTEIRRQVGYLPGEFALYGSVAGQEVLDMLGSFYPSVPWRQEACEAMELSLAELKRKTREYSTGMKQKLGIIQAVQHAPRLLILDEPTRGLDPLIQRNFFTLIDSLNKRGTTIFMSTHVLSEVERLCHEVGIIREGELLVVDEVANLRRQRYHRLEVTFSEPVTAPAMPDVKCYAAVHLDNTLVFETRGELKPVLDFVAAQPVTSMVCERARLDDIFMRYYAKEGVEPSA
ncbi:MAG: putative ABC transporter ATP-binding protein YbhF [Firmicutes bacterium]|nr:putative ABC transporter ATP-binding protein YbhF [candidate division NPL-UPA2 bacterium]MBT9154623.1 putative ABC transporter ATP-binding protein YbhF [candidate division NPL-UPA2 bacterium]MBT9155702.1 putative ABC transporter ATP-binding protein YbhF [candidate division NPL-UPA2 bacterium]